MISGYTGLCLEISLYILLTWNKAEEEKFEDIKGVIRSCKSKKDRQYNDQKKDRQYNGQKKKDRQYNGQKKKDRQYNGQKKKDRQYNG